MALSIKIKRAYTLPQGREERGRLAVETLVYDAADYRSPAEWAAEELANAGATRHNWGRQYVSEEPKITDFARGEEMTATGELDGFTQEQLQEVYRLMAGA